MTDASTSIKRCEPPLKSKPRFICFDGKILGKESIFSVDNKFGKAKIIPRKETIITVSDLNLEK